MYLAALVGGIHDLVECSLRCVSSSSPYRSNVAFGSCEKSTRSGTLACIRNAISYC